MNKYSIQDAKAIQNTCFKLNTLQLQTLLGRYLYAKNEPHIPAVSTLELFLFSPQATDVFPISIKRSRAAFSGKLAFISTGKASLDGSTIT